MSDLRDRKTGRFEPQDPILQPSPTPSKPPSTGSHHPPSSEPVTGRLQGLVVSTHLKDHAVLSVLAGPDAGAVVDLDGDEWYLGRGTDCQAQFNDVAMSRRHARIFSRGGQMMIEDLGSTNGTFVQGVRLGGPHPLADGDRIQIANTLVKFSLQDALEHEAALQLYESSVRDPLTGAYNRRHLNDRLVAEFAYAARHGNALSVLILDIDHFKRINDTYGHQAGDAVLCVMARSLLRIVRTEDLVARYGGEEFLVMLRNIEHDGALALSDRIRRSLEHNILPWGDSSIRVTASIGVATLHAAGGYSDPDALLAAADEALYAAKEGGRNRVVGDQELKRATDPPPEPAP